MDRQCDLLIIGAGPFGLAMAAYARHLDIDHLVVGNPMSFWKEHMPAGMLLRSACDWHLDAACVYTIERFVDDQGLKSADVTPLSLEFYLSYAQWFQQQAAIEAMPSHVRRLDMVDRGGARFQAEIENGDVIRAKHVLLAIGFTHFAHQPGELIARLPRNRFKHTCDLVDLEGLKGKRCLIVGGRQSSLEWAALLNDAGAETVHVSYRHDSPRFVESDWAWVNPLIERFVTAPGWYRALPSNEREALNYRFGVEGRLKVEPWLEPRCRTDQSKLWPRTQIESAMTRPDGEIQVALNNGSVLAVDQIILATGYKADISKAASSGQPAVEARVTRRLPNAR
ncbi:MAG: NAD(P)-binding domain-containing protein [Gammaproteobacteria bacterium]